MMISITNNIWDKDALNEFLYLFYFKDTCPQLQQGAKQDKGLVQQNT